VYAIEDCVHESSVDLVLSVRSGPQWGSAQGFSLAAGCASWVLNFLRHSASHSIFLCLNSFTCKMGTMVTMGNNLAGIL
jgi:hypothetical protein